MRKIRLSETEPVESSDLESLRSHAAQVFKELEEKLNIEIASQVDPPPSWVGSQNGKLVSSNNEPELNNSGETGEEERTFRQRYFDSNGFWVARGFCDAEETSKLKLAMTDSVRRNWFPKGSRKGERDSGEEENVTTFGTDTKSNEARGDEFLESADKVSYFAEPTALDSETGYLKPEFLDDSRDGDEKSETKKVLALNKAGHGLHLPPNFHESSGTGTAHELNEHNQSDVHKPFFEYTTSPKLRELVLSLGYRDPVVPQSMYIFKNPTVGGAVHSHQDSTFLYTTPRQTCLGLWLALDDATLENGCLWVRPRSHFEPVRRQFIRNPKFKVMEDGSDNGEPKLTFRQHQATPVVTWEGTLPESVEVHSDHDRESTDASSLGFIPVEVRAGDLVVFCGTLDHFSLPNFSDQQRHTFQLHLVEGSGAGVAWSSENWLQYGDGTSRMENNFMRLLDYE